MEDKTFDLLTKMYKEFTDFRTEIKSDVQKLSNQVVKIEQDHGARLDALLDGYKQLSEGQEGIKGELMDLCAKVENQDVQITVLKGGKQATR
jgi:phage shock protein A